MIQFITVKEITARQKQTSLFYNLMADALTEISGPSISFCILAKQLTEAIFLCFLKLFLPSLNSPFPHLVYIYSLFMFSVFYINLGKILVTNGGSYILSLHFH